MALLAVPFIDTKVRHLVFSRGESFHQRPIYEQLKKWFHVPEITFPFIIRFIADRDTGKLHSQVFQRLDNTDLLTF